jgi:hypothetical protein
VGQGANCQYLEPAESRDQSRLVKPGQRAKLILQILIRNRNQVNAYPFVEIAQVGRSIKSNPKPETDQQPGKHKGHRTFTIGASYEYGAVISLGVAKRKEGISYPVQISESQATIGLKVGQGIEPSEPWRLMRVHYNDSAQEA